MPPRSRAEARAASHDPSVLYLVSGDANIRPSHTNLRRAGKRVRFDVEVSDDAFQEFKAGKRYVVVAHGTADGKTVKWFKSATGASRPWLWVGMRRPPRDARIYLYACHAGRKLPRYLRSCEAFGHLDEVPMPTGGARDAVLGFLSEVEAVVANWPHNAATWRAHLADFVNRAYVAEIEGRTGLLTGQALLLLRKSLGSIDP